MHGGDRSRYTAPIAIAVCAVAAIIFVATVAALSWQEAVQSERRDNSAHAHAESAKASAQRACVGVNPSRVFDCVYEHVEAADETARAEQDLSAQQAMSRWALITWAIGLVTLFVSGAGLFALMTTIRQGREALLNVRHQTRPFLYVDKIEGKWDNGVWRATVYIRNVGETPAFNIRASFRIWDLWETVDSLGSGFENVDMKVCPRNAARRAFPRVNMPKATHTHILDGFNSIIIKTSVVYDSYFAKGVEFSETKSSSGADFLNNLFNICDLDPPDEDPDLVDLMGDEDEMPPHGEWVKDDDEGDYPNDEEGSDSDEEPC